MDIQFVGRRKEMAELTDLINNPKPGIAIVYGRRRIGKSLLIKESLKDKRAIIIEGIENRPKKEQIVNFLFQLDIQTGNTEKKSFATWREVFHYLSLELTKCPCPVIFDEFQWMANYRTDLVADLKMAWDLYLSKISGSCLILCGSIASFMLGKVIQSSALYGRIDIQMNIRAFKLWETAQMLNKRGVDEILEAHLFTGGVPKYLELLKEKSSVRTGIQASAFSANGYFVFEFDRIFSSHFGRNHEFGKIIEVLANNPYGLFRNQISEKTGIARGGGLSTRIADLEAAGFISSQTPFGAGDDSRKVRYFLHDAFLRFYYAFQKGNIKDIIAGINTERFSQIWASPAYRNWLGHAFEHLCFQHAECIAELLGFSGIRYSCGPYFKVKSQDSAGIQIDFVFDRSDNVLSLCEIKYHSLPVGKSIIPEVERKAEFLRGEFPRKTVLPVLITNLHPTSDLLDAKYFSRIVTIKDILDRRLQD